MKVNGKHYRTIWLDEDQKTIHSIDQRQLPHYFVIEQVRTLEEMAVAIKDMHLRGAGLIGAAAAFGIYLATIEAPKDSTFDEYLLASAVKLKATRPTAVNLAWAADFMLEKINTAESIENKILMAKKTAQQIVDEDAEMSKTIGVYGLKIIEEINKKKKGEVVNILTHCNAGWLAFVDYGTATAPIYAAFEKGIKVHVWVDETRPRSQGAQLTAWELGMNGVPHTLIPDNTGGHLMQHGMVDMVIVGTDRTTRLGDVANKIGTYLKAVAAKDNNVPFYVALPSSSIDWTIKDGVKEISIEEREQEEVKYMSGLCDDGKIRKVLIAPKDSPASNYGFDVTPARLITALITERGICSASEKGLLELFTERKKDF